VNQQVLDEQRRQQNVKAAKPLHRIGEGLKKSPKTIGALPEAESPCLTLKIG